MLRLCVCMGLVVTLAVLLWPSEGFQPDENMIWKMRDVANTSAFCAMANMDEDECAKLFENDEIVDDNGEKMVVSGQSSRIALFDACNPREQTVALPRHPDPDITIWPTCTRAMRCGGCCTSDVFSCEPTETIERFVKIFDTRLPYLGAQRFQFLGVRAVKIIEHTSCDAQCKTKEHECHRYQVYEARKCRCVCRPKRLELKKQCKKNQIWDDSECDCICPNRATALCPEPSYFSTTTCKCTVKMGVSGEIDLDALFKQIKQIDKGLIGPDIILNNKYNGDGGEIDSVDKEIQKSDEEIEKEIDRLVELEEKNNEKEGKEKEDDGHGDKDGDEDKEEESTTTPETTTTTTTTSTTPATTTPPKPTTTKDPCEHVKCVSDKWKAKLIHNGNCQCQPNFKFPFRG